MKKEISQKAMNIIIKMQRNELNESFIYKNIAKKKLQDFPLLFARKGKNKGKLQIKQMLMGGKVRKYWKALKMHEQIEVSVEIYVV